MSRLFGTVMLGLLAVSGCKNDTNIGALELPPGGSSVPAPISIVKTDRILQVGRPAIDVLFVVDNSCSMEEEQALLASNFPLFMGYFLNSGLDYHIGVISTDMMGGLDAGKLHAAQGYRYISDTTLNPAAVFSQMARLGANGSGEERGRDAVYTAIELRADSPSNEGFYRPGAGLEVIFVSDENDYSSQNEPEFLEWFEGLKWAPERTQAHVIVGPPGIDTCQEAVEPGYDYLELAANTEGQTFSICNQDWGPMLDTLGLAASGLKQEYFLSSLPVVSSIEVAVVTPDGIQIAFEDCIAGDEIEDPECRVIYNSARNSIVFLDYTPDPAAEVLIEYAIRENFGDPDL